MPWSIGGGFCWADMNREDFLRWIKAGVTILQKRRRASSLLRTTAWFEGESIKA
jgi:hypothetical protein